MRRRENKQKRHEIKQTLCTGEKPQNKNVQEKHTNRNTQEKHIKHNAQEKTLTQCTGTNTKHDALCKTK